MPMKNHLSKKQRLKVKTRKIMDFQAGAPRLIQIGSTHKRINKQRFQDTKRRQITDNMRKLEKLLSREETQYKIRIRLII